MKIDELLKQRAKIDAEIEAIKQKEIELLKSEIKERQDRLKALGYRSAAPGKGVRSKPAAKYLNPKTGETWSGRGRPSKWLKEKLDAGESIDKYAI